MVWRRKRNWSCRLMAFRVKEATLSFLLCLYVCEGLFRMD